jgi:hypothetical protein
MIDAFNRCANCGVLIVDPTTPAEDALKLMIARRVNQLLFLATGEPPRLADPRIPLFSC